MCWTDLWEAGGKHSPEKPGRIDKGSEHVRAGSSTERAKARLAPGQIARDDAATEPENRVVGGGDRRRLVTGPNNSSS